MQTPIHHCRNIEADTDEWEFFEEAGIFIPPESRSKTQTLRGDMAISRDLHLHQQVFSEFHMHTWRGHHQESAFS